jgi:hypothetical protein
MIVAGAPVTEFQHLLGHSSPQTTLKVSSHWFANMQSDSVHRLSWTLAGNFGHFLDIWIEPEDRLKSEGALNI